jgi:hypothetical protein
VQVQQAPDQIRPDPQHRVKPPFASLKKKTHIAICQHQRDSFELKIGADWRTYLDGKD